MSLCSQTDLRIGISARTVSAGVSSSLTSKDASNDLIKNLRQRVVRLTMKHREETYQHQKREELLLAALRECSNALEEAISLLNISGQINLPDSISKAAFRSRQFTLTENGNGTKND